MKKRRIARALAALLALALAAALLSCGQKPEDPAPSPDPAPQSSETPAASTTPTATTKIECEGDSAEVSGSGAAFADKKVTISAAGVYELTGTLEDGQILVNVQKTEKVTLVLNNVSVSCSTSAPLYCASSDKVEIYLAEGSVNSFTDGVDYEFATSDDEPNACIYSADDLSFAGSGSLSVSANYKNGISSKNDIKFAEGAITVNAINTGVRGKDSITVESGSLTVKAGNDGLKSTTLDAGKGFVLVSGGNVSIDAEDDALQAENDISITGGSVTARAAGKTLNCPGTQNITPSCLIEK